MMTLPRKPPPPVYPSTHGTDKETRTVLAVSRSLRPRALSRLPLPENRRQRRSEIRGSTVLDVVHIDAAPRYVTPEVELTHPSLHVVEILRSPRQCQQPVQPWNRYEPDGTRDGRLGVIEDFRELLCELLWIHVLQLEHGKRHARKPIDIEDTNHREHRRDFLRRTGDDDEPPGIVHGNDATAGRERLEDAPELRRLREAHRHDLH